MEQKSVCTVCRFCGQQCHLLADVDEKGKVQKIRPDMKYHTIWCATGKNGLNLMNHPDRVRVPLRRVGQKGLNQWEEISWEEAFLQIGYEFRKAVDTYGPNTFLGIRGFNKPYFNLIYERWMNTIGTVNSMGAANMCHAASMNAAKETFGFMPNLALTEKSRFVVLWGSNPYNTSKGMAASIQQACKRGVKLIVIDPCNTHHAQKADVWIPIKPGTDMALALGMIHLVIENQWYDTAYIEKCTYGFEELKAFTKGYTLERIAEITNVPGEMIEKAARIMALEGPGLVDIGNAMDHNEDSFQKSRAINILIAITGNVDRDGALTGREPLPSKFMQQRKQITRAELCPYNDPEKRKQIIGYQENYLNSFNESSGKALADALNTGEPYPIKVAYVQGGNPAMIWENREELVKAFCKLDFMVVSDFFITPTAMLADIILPAAVYMEYESIKIEDNGTIFYSPNLVPEATAKSDLELINEMGKAMGYKETFWETMDDYWNDYLKPFDISLEQVRREKVILSDEKPRSITYGKFRENGFPTATGKINLYSENMVIKGNPPIPVYHDYTKTTKAYPYVSTNYKSQHFYHTAGRQIKEQRRKEQDPIAFISKDIADERNLKEGDWILVYTAAGSVRQRAHIDAGMSKKTVALAHGWWYPEKEKTPFVLEACSNNIVFDDRLIGKELPSFTTRGLPCDVQKALQYEDIYPKNSKDIYDVEIAYTSETEYMHRIEELMEKGFLEGNPQFVFHVNCQEQEHLILWLKEQGHRVKAYVEHGWYPQEGCAACDTVIFRLTGKITQDVEAAILNIRKRDPFVRCEIEYLMWQNNMGEKYLVKEWAEQRQLHFCVKYASFDDEKKLAYLSGKMTTHDIIKEAKTLFFHYVDDLIENQDFYYEKYQGKEPVIVNTMGELESEWDISGQERIALLDVRDYEEWRTGNREIFLQMTRNPSAGVWWLWKRNSITVAKNALMI